MKCPALTLRNRLGSRLGGTGADLADNSAAAAQAAAAGQAVRVDADAGRADAWSDRRLPACPPAQKSAAFGAAQDFARQKRAVPLHRDIEIVLEHQRDHVLHRKVEISRRAPASPGAASWSAWPAPLRAFPDETASGYGPTYFGGGGDWIETSDDWAKMVGTDASRTTAKIFRI